MIFIKVDQEDSDTMNQEVIDCESPFDEVTENGTTITSTNYPSNYENSQDCQATIRFASDEIVRITFEAFDVEEHDDCIYDYLEIHDGDGTSSPSIGSKLCGTGPLGNTLHSTGNVMTLHFHSDYSGAETGFKALVRVIKGKLICQIFENKDNFDCL